MRQQQQQQWSSEPALKLELEQAQIIRARVELGLLDLGLESGSGLGILDFRAQIHFASFIINHFCATFGYRALTGLIKSRAWDFLGIGLM